MSRQLLIDKLKFEFQKEVASYIPQEYRPSDIRTIEIKEEFFKGWLLSRYKQNDLSILQYLKRRNRPAIKAYLGI